ncbi:heat shock 70 kDa protein cognate 4-like [Euwallacea similis]|uniref:heat shock 70 kDa protein cognate 4-like n=1 Tax=Euwallacea similis TaxID=1736056 RepID=UPI00344B25E7
MGEHSKREIPAVGIDLGTTLSGVAVFRNGHTIMIPNEQGDTLTPSSVFYQPENDEVLIGDVANDLGVARIANLIFDNKRIIGRRYEDVYVQEFKKSQKYAFKIKKGENDDVEIQLRHNKATTRKTPEEVSSEVLKYLKNCASKYLGGEITEAVISVPAYFSNAQRRATKRAAELADLKVLKLVTEPVAAAIHYVQDRLDTAAILLVFDFGGGTLDVSIIDIDEKKFCVKSVEGNTHLGGRDIDDVIFDYFQSDVLKKLKSVPVNAGYLRRIRKLSTKMKIRLSTLKEFSFGLDYIAGPSTLDLMLSMTRDQLEHAIRHFLIQAQDLIEKCLKGAGLAKEDITDVLLVGGSSRIPKVQEMIRTYFDKSQIHTDIMLDEAVALGASLQAAVLQKKHEELEKYQITEITPLDLGIAQDMNLMLSLIKKNSPIPVTSEPYFLTTNGNNQKYAVVEIYEGQRANCKFNNLLGTFVVNNLPPATAGDVVCKIMFKIDKDGILEVEAKKFSGETANKLVITLSEFRLCDWKIRDAEEEAEAYKEEDELFKKFVYYFYTVRDICLLIINNLPEINCTDNALVRSECQNFICAIYQFQFQDLEKLKARYQTFKKSVETTVQQFIEIDMPDG